MAEDAPMSELYAAVVEWATALGATRIQDLPGLWSGETDEWEVGINGHYEMVDGLAFGQMRLRNKKYLQIAILDPFGGAIGGGGSEDDMIAHFREAILPPLPRANIYRREDNAREG